MSYLKPVFCALMFMLVCFTPGAAHANIVDALNLSPFVPMVLDALMMVATGTYDFFVGAEGREGIIHILIWVFLGFTLAISLAKMYIPQKWLGFIGLSGGGELASGKITGVKIIENIAKPGLRAIIASVLLLQLKPVYVTEWLVNPFLQLGAIYTNAITANISQDGVAAPDVECPADIVAKAWISESSCEFLIQPVSDLSHANNQIIKRGFNFLTSGLRGMMTLIPHGGENLLNFITGILLIFTFVGSNIFMALLIIQGIFNFGMQLILYPFYVLTYVFKSSEKWLDVWPAFGGITKALQQLVVTMIACSFMLCVNLAVIKALFRWNSSVFVVAADGRAYSNIPAATNSAMGFGEHSILWLSAILTFYLMMKIFELTQKQLNKYIGSGMDGLYKQVKSDAGALTGDIKNWGKSVGKAVGWIKGKK
ncbi:MAG: hypothetical protein R8N50_01435 [Alphaproteobacteria bacterium]|nr:hypothetical protein [Alphaproteobacteria bacterium]